MVIRTGYLQIMKVVLFLISSNGNRLLESIYTSTSKSFLSDLLNGFSIIILSILPQLPSCGKMSMLMTEIFTCISVDLLKDNGGNPTTSMVYEAQGSDCY